VLERIAAAAFGGVDSPQLASLLGLDNGSMYHVLNRLTGAGLAVKVPPLGGGQGGGGAP
jgi:hypothetical protein